MKTLVTWQSTVWDIIEISSETKETYSIWDYTEKNSVEFTVLQFCMKLISPISIFPASSIELNKTFWSRKIYILFNVNLLQKSLFTTFWK